MGNAARIVELVELGGTGGGVVDEEDVEHFTIVTRKLTRENVCPAIGIGCAGTWLTLPCSLITVYCAALLVLL